MLEVKRGRQPAKGVAARECPACGREFQPYRETQRACSRTCREAVGMVPESERTHTVSFVCVKCGARSVRGSTITGGRFKFCLECVEAANMERRLRKQESRKLLPNRSAKSREYNLKRYGLTVQQHAAMESVQGGICAICGDAPKPGGVRAASRLHIDHDHASGRVRGLLCNHCNRGLGSFRDRRDLLELAVNYLVTHDG